MTDPQFTAMVGNAYRQTTEALDLLDRITQDERDEMPKSAIERVIKAQSQLRLAYEQVRVHA